MKLLLTLALLTVTGSAFACSASALSQCNQAQCDGLNAEGKAVKDFVFRNNACIKVDAAVASDCLESSTTGRTVVDKGTKDGGTGAAGDAKGK